MILASLAVALILIAVAIFCLRFAYMRTKAEVDDDRAKIMVEFVKLVVQSIAAVAIVVPIIPTLLNFQRQWEQSVYTQRLQTDQENNAQFALAIEKLRAPDLTSTEGALAMLDLLRRRDRVRFEDPVRRVLRATLIELQDDSPSHIIDIATSDRAQRYARVLEYFIASAQEARRQGVQSDDGLINLQFVRVRRIRLSEVGASVSLDNATIFWSELWGVDASGSSFKNADMQFSSFVRATLTRASFRRAQLSDFSFSGADLSYADFTGADLTRTRLAGANLHCADLRGATLTGADVDLETLLPAYVAPETALPDVISYDQIVDERRRRRMQLNCERQQGADS